MSEDVEIEAVEVIEEEVSKIKKVKVHLKKNQKEYLFAAGYALGAGIVLTTLSIALRKPIVINYIMIKLDPNMAFVGGRTQKLVRDEATGLIYESVTDASALTGVSRRGISKVINGQQKIAGGRKWTVIGIWSPWWGR